MNVFKVIIKDKNEGQERRKWIFFIFYIFERKGI